MGQQRFVHVGGVELCVETFGDPSYRAILLIGGASSSMDWWEDEVCERLAAGLRFVIRYDNRDTGQSTSYTAGQPGYQFEDLVTDALGLLHVVAAGHAHVVGISMGGMIAQHLAVRHADRVDSLTLISTSPGGPGGPSNPDLPVISEQLQSFFSTPRSAPDWSDRGAVIDYVVEGERWFGAPGYFDEARTRQLAGRMFDRTRDIAASMTNHFSIAGGDPVRHRLGEITAPTLVIHGTADPLFPYGHAEALGREIPDAYLLPLEGVGHQMPPPQMWNVVVAAILRHTSSGSEEQGKGQAPGD
jgi:pimeloyl-ACP methyl ester carboxylesterase